MSDWAIETDRVGKYYTAGRTKALEDVSLRVLKGEICALLGSNGAGKTTLIKIISGLMPPDSGKVMIFGEDIFCSAKIRRKISLVLGDERSFYWRLTGRQNLEFFAALYNIDRCTSREKIKKAASLLGIRELDKPYQLYSTGNKSRLALARSFLNDADIILMDEPTKSLDPATAAAFRELVRYLRDQQGKTFFFATHDLNEVESLADRIGVLHRGQYVEPEKDGRPLLEIFKKEVVE